VTNKEGMQTVQVFLTFFINLDETICHQVIITLPSVGVAEYCDNCVCLLVCPWAYLWNWMSDLHELFCACYLLLWLFPHLALWCFCISCLMDEHRGCYGSHTRPVVRECCKVTIKVNRIGGNLTPHHPKTPQTMVTKICVGDYVGDIYQHAKFHPNRFSVSVLRMRDFAPIGTKWLGYFLGGFLRKATAETHRFWRKIRQTTQFRAFWGSRNQYLRFGPPFPPPPKTAIFGPFRPDRIFLPENGFNIGRLECKRPLIVVGAQ